VGHVNYAPLASMVKQIQPLMRFGVMLYGIDAWQRLKGLRRRAVLQADFLISISEYTKQKAIEANGLDGSRVHLLPNALEGIGDQLSSVPSEHVDTGSTCLLSVCRLEKSEQYKGVDKVIEALPAVAMLVPNIQYIVVGGGTDLERHQELAQKVGVNDRVHFTGFVTDEALHELYHNCDLFVMPSAGEGFGFVFLEAMKYGKPILAANSGGAPEVVQDGITGQLVEYGDRQELAEALINLCLDPAKRTRMGNAGYQRLQDNFTFPHFNDKFSAILRQQMPTKSLLGAGSSATERTVQTP
jgi:phosphatidylinositol alpha-1,6-mannosyltransferase